MVKLLGLTAQKVGTLDLEKPYRLVFTLTLCCHWPCLGNVNVLSGGSLEKHGGIIEDQF